jgi:hypothetical protein
MRRFATCLALLWCMFQACTSASYAGFDNAPYILDSADGTLPNSRSAVWGNNFTVTDAGAGSTLTLQNHALTTLTSATNLTSASVTVQLCDATSAAFTVSLPASSANAQKVFYIAKTDSSAHAVTVACNGSDTISGANTYSISSQYQFLKIQADGVSKWTIIGTNNFGDLVGTTGFGAGSVTSVSSTLNGLTNLMTVSGVPITGSGSINYTASCTLGDVIYGSASDVFSRLAGNSTSTPMYLKSLGASSVATAPTWAQIASGDISGTFTSSQLPTATVYNNQGNVYTGTYTNDFSASGQSLRTPNKSDPGSPQTGEIWTNSSLLKFQDNAGTPLKHTVATIDVANGYTAAQTPSTAGGVALGTTTLPWSQIVFGNAATNNTILASGTLTAQRTCYFPDAASNPIQPLSSQTSNSWLEYIDGNGLQHVGQVGFSNLSGTATAAQLPSTAVNSTGNCSPLFTSGINSQALSFTLSNAAGYSWFGNSSSSSGAPAFNTSVLPNSLVNWASPAAIGSTAPAAVTATTLSATSISLTNPAPIASGGTNTSATPTSNGVVYGTGTAQAYTSAGTSSYPLLAGSPPAFGQLNLAGSGVTGTLPGGNMSQIALGSTGNGGVGGTLPAANVSQINLGNSGNGGVTGTLPGANVAAVTLGSSDNGGVSGILLAANGGSGSGTNPTNGQIPVGQTSTNSYIPTTPTSGTGIGLSLGAGSLQINNTGVTGNVAGAGISVSSATGTSTITNTGVTSITGSGSVTTSANTGGVTVNDILTVNGLRLYLVSGNPTETTSSSSNIYIGPSLTNQCTFDNGSGVLSTYTMTEQSKSLSGLTSGAVYDVYMTSGGTISLTKWSSNTTTPTRGSDAAGRPTASGNTAALWFGIIETISTTATEASATFMAVSNAYNQVPGVLLATNSMVSTTTSSTSFVNTDSNTTDGVGRIHWIQALPNMIVPAMYRLTVYAATSGVVVFTALALDGTVENGEQGRMPYITSGVATEALATYTATSSEDGEHTLQGQMSSSNSSDSVFAYGTGTTGCSCLIKATLMW